MIGTSAIGEKGKTMTDFEKELIEYVFMYLDQDDPDLPCEVVCRKLYKYGLIDKKDGYWMMKENE